MYLLAFNLTLFEIIILQLGAIVLGITIYFFWTSNKALSATLKQSRSRLDIIPKKGILERLGINIITIEDLQERVSKLKNRPAEVSVKKNHPVQHVPEPVSEISVTSLKEAVVQQQHTLGALLKKIDSLESNTHSKKDLLVENEGLEKKIEKLELLLDTKEGEIKRIKQQEAVAQQMAARIDEVYKEFDLLQHKIISLEKQAGKANELTIELEDAKQLSEQLQKDLERKHEKLEELIEESQRLHNLLNTTEDKLAEANLQRQQLQKKVQFLQDVNNDMQHVSESNKKLQNELRRIGELESMLSMIADERDRLLNKGYKE